MARYLIAWLAGCGACGREFREAEVKIRMHNGKDKAAVSAAVAALRSIAHAERWLLPTDYDLDDETETRCPDCARQRRASDPTTLYLIRSKRRNALKVGVAGAMSTRLKTHYRRGWEMVELNGRPCLWLMSRTDALTVERAVVQRWRNAGVPMALACTIAAENGYTETASLDTALIEVRPGRRPGLTYLLCLAPPFTPRFGPRSCLPVLPTRSCYLLCPP